MKLCLVILLLTVSFVAQADNREWTTGEREWAAAAVVFTITDWATTRNMARRYNENYYEHNPILGSHPSTAQINRYFAITVPVMYLVADNLDEYRRPFLMGLTGVEFAVSANNLRIGLHLDF